MEFVWVKFEFVLAAHKRQIAEHGGADGIRDEGLLHSALARPENLFAYGENVDLPALAASYAFGIAKNPANRGVLCATRSNGFHLNPTQR